MREHLQAWDIGCIDAIAPTAPYWGGKTWYVTTAAKEYVLKELDLRRAQREHQVLLDLGDTRVPVAMPIPTAAGDWTVEGQDGKVYSLYPRLPGRFATAHYAGDAKERALGFGRAIGLLHICLQECDAKGYQELGLVEEIERWAIPCIRNHGATVDVRVVERIWRGAESELRSLYRELPKQLIHRDAHPSNMLFSAGHLTGILDFEMLVRGPRVFDICYCGSSILVDGFEHPEKELQWPSLFHSVVRGYEECISLTPSERQAIYGVFVIIELLFIAYSLETQNPEVARMNERLLCWLANNRDLLPGWRTADSA